MRRTNTDQQLHDASEREAEYSRWCEEWQARRPIPTTDHRCKAATNPADLMLPKIGVSTCIGVCRCSCAGCRSAVDWHYITTGERRP